MDRRPQRAQNAVCECNQDAKRDCGWDCFLWVGGRAGGDRHLCWYSSRCRWHALDSSATAENSILICSSTSPMPLRRAPTPACAAYMAHCPSGPALAAEDLLAPDVDGSK